MSNFNEQNAWAENIRMIMPGDKVIGGVGGQINVLLGAIINRTLYNKTAIAAAVQSIGGLGNTKADKTVTITAGAGLTGGGNLAANRTIALGTPGTITGSSTNSVTSTSHTHAIDSATTSRPGVVTLSSAINSAAESLAATPKAVRDALAKANESNLSLYGDLGAKNLNSLYAAGHYGVHHQAVHGAATANLNYPVSLGGALLVMPSRFGALQLYLPSGQGVLYVRDTESSQTYGAWRAIGEVVNSLGSTSATAALSAAQGRTLNNVKANKSTTLSGYGITDAVTQAQLTAAINGIVGGAPGALDTLRELAAAIGNNANYAAQVTNELGNAVKLSGDQTINGHKTFAYPVKITGYRLLPLWSWRESIHISGPHGAVMLNGEYGIGLHQAGKKCQWLDTVNNRAGMVYDYQAQSLAVTGDITAGGVSVGALNTGKADKTTAIAAGNGLTGGGSLAANRTIALGTPGTITGSSANSVTSTSHTHAIDSATTSRPGVVQLNNTLTSSSTAQALTAAQGKALQDTKADKTELAVAAPPGQIAFFAGPNAPAGWLKANGAAVSRATYAPLFAAIGTRYGTGNGSSTFNLPDLRGEFVRGWDDGRNIDSGRVLGSRQSDAIRNITGEYFYGLDADLNSNQIQQINARVPGNSALHFGDTKMADSIGYVSWLQDGTAINFYALRFDASRSVPTAAENRPRNVALLACIKI